MGRRSRGWDDSKTFGTIDVVAAKAGRAPALLNHNLRALVIGCGYVGVPLAKELLRHGHQVTGLTRSASHAKALFNEGISPMLADISRAEDLARQAPAFDWVINLVSSGRGGMEAYRSVYLDGTRNVIAWLKTAPPRLFVAASSTSVYGQADGSPVTETGPTEPSSETGRIIVEMEQLLLSAASMDRLPVALLRLAGIYGPGRTHLIDQFQQPESGSSPTRIVNMIHRDDVIGAILAALARGTPGQVYNVVDDEPVSRAEVFAWLAHRLPREPAVRSGETAATSPTRATTNKRVLNHKLKAELGYALRYPTFREGFDRELKECLAAES